MGIHKTRNQHIIITNEGGETITSKSVEANLLFEILKLLEERNKQRDKDEPK